MVPVSTTRTRCKNPITNITIPVLTRIKAAASESFERVDHAGKVLGGGRQLQRPCSNGSDREHFR